jgi:L-alanine-DL-glutamate epimerase-like enolase superfamily enzyme
MRVRSSIAELALEEAFVISRGSRHQARVIRVEIAFGDLTGYGEGAPIERYGESVESAARYLDEHSAALGSDPFALETIFARLPAKEFAARAGLDAALHDLQGKLLGRPTWTLLGLSRQGPPASWTISLDTPDAMAASARRAARRFKRLKVKLGGRDGLDLDRVRAVAEVAALPLKVDVNEAWSYDEAVESLPVLAELGVEFCEQPLPAGDARGEQLKALSPLPIYLDEDCHTLADIAKCARRAHGINVKLAKAGGIREALRIVHAARALGLRCMLGCMVESGLGIAAAAQIASLFDHADLDGNLLLRDDPWPIVTLVDGKQLPSESSGLGTSLIAPSANGGRRSQGSAISRDRTVLALTPLLAKPENGAEQLSQVLPGEPIAVLNADESWARVETAYGYPGWIITESIGTEPNAKWLDATVEHPVDHARSLVGTPYLWGGMTEHGIDCSGLVHMSYRATGTLVPRDAYQQEAAGSRIEASALALGDLVTYGDGDRAQHIAFWVGDGRILHSTQRDGLNRVLEEMEPPSLRDRRRSTFRL